MITLKNKKIDDYGNIIFTESGLMDLLYQDIDLEDIQTEDSDDVKKYNRLVTTYDHPELKVPIYTVPDISIEDFDKTLQDQWFMPDEYKSLDVKDFLLTKCKTQIEIDRVEEEYPLFEKLDMLMVLRLLIFLVNYMREHKIVWGVGRGSSCASYCLYLIGVHKINSIKYDLSIEEFLK